MGAPHVAEAKPGLIAETKHPTARTVPQAHKVDATESSNEQLMVVRISTCCINPTPALYSPEGKSIYNAVRLWCRACHLNLAHQGPGCTPLIATASGLIPCLLSITYHLLVGGLISWRLCARAKLTHHAGRRGCFPEDYLAHTGLCCCTPKRMQQLFCSDVGVIRACF